MRFLCVSILNALLPVLIFGIELDPNTLEEIINSNPDAYKEKILLAKYYEKNNNDIKALNIINNVIQKHPKDKNAQKLKKRILRKQHIKKVFKDANLTYPIDTTEAQKRLDSYYLSGNYQLYSNLYLALIESNFNLNDKYHIKAAEIYLYDSRYKQSQNALKMLNNKHTQDALKIKAQTCYYLGDYKCSTKLFEKLYNTNYNLNYGIKLTSSYIYLGRIEDANRLYSYLKRHYQNTQELKTLGKDLDDSQNKYIQNKKKIYENTRNLKTLKDYTMLLYSLNKQKEAVDIVKNFNKTDATKESLLLEAKYLVWSSKTDEALKILQQNSVFKTMEAKLMLAQIYSWEQKFTKAKKYLNEIINKSKDKTLLYNAKKTLAFIYMWENNPKKAKNIFYKLYAEKKDTEIQEALMELENNYKSLVSIYEKKIKKEPTPQNIKKLALFYTKNNQLNKAKELLEKYIQKNPHDIEANKTLALLLIEKKDYYKGFGYLEYFTATKQTLQSYLTLAKYYYWNGFSKEALDVLEKTIKKYPNSQEALKLKADILKVSPRFTTNNSGITTQIYFEKIGVKQLMLADSLYFNSHYKASLMYYESYLNKHPDDNEARYRYAFALENAKEYAKAEGEFSLMFKTKNSQELRYHYAYNMMKNNKLKEAKKLFLELKEDSFSTVDKNIEKFIFSWRDAWQSKDFKKYATFYAKSFLKNTKWSSRKLKTFSNAKYISVKIDDIVSKKLDKNRYEVKFYQYYTTDKSGDKGYKILHIECDSTKTECKITKELWKASEYKKTIPMQPYIDNALKEIKRLESLPLVFNYPKKKTIYKKHINITILS